MKLLKTFGILLIVVAVFGGAMFALNFLTGPIIEANKAGAANDRLNEVMPGGTAYEDITATLSGLPANVVKVSKETSGLGYVIECTATSNYTGGDPMDIVIGVDAEGKICGIKLFSHSESKIFDENYPSTYIGKDSALTGVELFAGVTFSSTAFKNAVSDAMGVLISNNLIKEGVKTDEQILAEMIPTHHTGFLFAVNNGFKADKMAESGDYVEGYKALNGSGYAFIMQSGDAKLLVLVNAAGVCKVVDLTGADVTAANEELCKAARKAAGMPEELAETVTYATNVTTAAEAMIKAKYGDNATITPVSISSFGNVVYAATVETADATYYAFYSAPLTYENNVMSILTVIDAQGKIASQSIKQMAFGEGVEHMYGIMDYDNTNSPAFKDYLNSFNGLTTAPDTHVAGATTSLSAVTLATNDAFAAFKTINKGGDQ